MCLFKCYFITFNLYINLFKILSLRNTQIKANEPIFKIYTTQCTYILEFGFVMEGVSLHIHFQCCLFFCLFWWWIRAYNIFETNCNVFYMPNKHNFSLLWKFHALYFDHIFCSSPNSSQILLHLPMQPTSASFSLLNKWINEQTNKQGQTDQARESTFWWLTTPGHGAPCRVCDDIACVTPFRKLDFLSPQQKQKALLVRMRSCPLPPCFLWKAYLRPVSFLNEPCII